MPILTSSSNHQKSEIFHSAIKGCHISFIHNLDVSVIFSHLEAQNLLTRHDKLVLRSSTITSSDKACYIMHILPRKGDGWFNKLLYCLRESADGTGHGYLLKEIENKFQEIIKKEETFRKMAPTEEESDEVQSVIYLYLTCVGKSRACIELLHTVFAPGSLQMFNIMCYAYMQTVLTNIL